MTQRYRMAQDIEGNGEPRWFILNLPLDGNAVSVLPSTQDFNNSVLYN